MKMKLYDEFDHLLWVGTVERIDPFPVSEAPLRVTVEVRELVAIPAILAQSNREKP